MPAALRRLAAWAHPGRRANRFWAFAVRARDLFPFTPLGVAFGVGAYAALRAFAYAELDLVWLVTGYAALGLAAISTLAVLPCACVVAYMLRKRPEHDVLRLETHRLTPTEYALPSLRFVPFVQLRWDWVTPDGASVQLRPSGGKLREWVEVPERGQHARVLRRVFVQDPFGLLRIALQVPEPREVWVMPNLGALAHLPQLTALAQGADLPHPMGVEEGDRLELSRYVPGDPARFIHWKAFARTRKLLVRRPERAVSVALRCAAYMIAGRGDDATAACARLSLERKLFGSDWVFGTDLDVVGKTRVDEALTQLVQSIEARDRGGAGLTGFLANVEKRGPASVIVFAPPEPGPWLSVVARAASRRQLRVVIGVDGVRREREPARWLSLFRAWKRAPSARAADLELVMTELARARIQVTVLDRSSGRALGDIGRRALFRAQTGARSARLAGGLS